VEQNTASKFGQKLRFLAVATVLRPKNITKNAKSTDKIVAPNPSFLFPKFAFS